MGVVLSAKIRVRVEVKVDAWRRAVGLKAEGRDVIILCDMKAPARLNPYEERGEGHPSNLGLLALAHNPKRESRQGEPTVVMECVLHPERIRR